MKRTEKLSVLLALFVIYLVAGAACVGLWRSSR